MSHETPPPSPSNPHESGPVDPGYQPSGFYDERFMAFMGLRTERLKRRKDALFPPHSSNATPGEFIQIAQAHVGESPLDPPKPPEPLSEEEIRAKIDHEYAEGKLSEEARDRQIHDTTGPAKIDNFALSSGFDPITAYQKSHTQVRGDYVEPGVAEYEPRTVTHKSAAVRGQLRQDGVRTRLMRVEELKHTYGPAIVDKKALSKQLKGKRMRLGEKLGVLRASREARRNLRAVARIQHRQHKSAEGLDIPGRLSR